MCLFGIVNPGEKSSHKELWTEVFHRLFIARVTCLLKKLRVPMSYLKKKTPFLRYGKNTA